MPDEVRSDIVSRVRIAREKGLSLTSVQRLIVKGKGTIKKAVQGYDTYLILEINGQQNGYKSYALMNGNAVLGEWGEDKWGGLYIGRNGWEMEADISFQYIIAIEPGRKRTGFGMSTFALTGGKNPPNNKILGFTSHGYWDNKQDNISEVAVWLVGVGVDKGTGDGSFDVTWE